MERVTKTQRAIEEAQESEVEGRAIAERNPSMSDGFLAAGDPDGKPWILELRG